MVKLYLYTLLSSNDLGYTALRSFTLRRLDVFEEFSGKLPQLVLVGGPPGCGKTTNVELVCSNVPNTERAITATTRPPRPNEIHQVDYLFETNEKFEMMIRNDELYEYVKRGEYYYGVPKASLETKEGVTKFFIVDYKGIETFAEIFPKAPIVWFTIPLAEVNNRLAKRGDTKKDRQKRIEYAKLELEWGEENMDMLGMIVINTFNRPPMVITHEMLSKLSQWT